MIKRASLIFYQLWNPGESRTLIFTRTNRSGYRHCCIHVNCVFFGTNRISRSRTVRFQSIINRNISKTLLPTVLSVWTVTSNDLIEHHEFRYTFETIFLVDGHCVCCRDGTRELRCEPTEFSFGCRSWLRFNITCTINRRPETITRADCPRTIVVRLLLLSLSSSY